MCNKSPCANYPSVPCSSWDIYSGELRSFNERFLSTFDLSYERAMGNPRPVLWSDFCGFTACYIHPETASRVQKTVRDISDLFEEMRYGRSNRQLLRGTFITPLGRVVVR